VSGVIEQGRHLLAVGRTGDAVRLLEAERQQGGGPHLFNLFGYALYQDNRMPEAVAVLNDAITRFPFSAALQEAAARMRWMNGDSEHYADDFLAAVAARPRDVALRFKCADTLRLAGNAPKAEQILREGLDLNPVDVGLGGALGVLLDEMGRLDEAVVINRNAVLNFPDDPSLRLGYAHTLQRLGRAEEARAEIVIVRRAHPQMQLAITQEATALKQLGDPKYGWLCNYERHVQVYDIEAPEGFASVAEFNATLGAYLRGLIGKSEHPLGQSLLGGSQTPSNLVFRDDPLLRTYFAALSAPIQTYIDALGDDREHPLEMRKAKRHALSGCWSVMLRPGGYHVNHTHPNGWISSSYYVSVPASVNESSQEGWIKFGEPRWPIPGVGVERVVQPKEGRVVLFPSYMWHGTIPFSSGERLTAPFDVVPA
jgi:tetratricopeptide (TPR) repeat protein